MESSEKSLLGKKIRKRRNTLGLSQDELARKSGVAYTSLTKIETGVIKNPSVYTVAKIAKTLKVSIEDLIFARNSNHK